MGRDQREKEGKWQTVTSKRNQTAKTGKAIQATPAKVANAGKMLLVAKSTLSPKGGEGEGYMESEDMDRFPEGYDEGKYQELY
jgi:hypothetical protein